MSNTRLTANALEPKYVGKGLCLQHQREPPLLVAEKDIERGEEGEEENRVPGSGSVPGHMSESDYAVMGAAWRSFVKAFESSCVVPDFIFIQAVIIRNHGWVGIVRAMRHL